MRSESFTSVCAGILASGLLIGCHRDPLNTVTALPSTQQPSASNQNRAEVASKRVDEDVLGEWKGTSLVQVKDSPARNETVVWHIKKGKSEGKLRVTADKIVNGKAVSMGALDFTYDQAQKLLVCRYEQGEWSLEVKGQKMEGTLTLRDNTILRRVALEKGSISDSGNGSH
jgi:hypothetical protein